MKKTMTLALVCAFALGAATFTSCKKEPQEHTITITAPTGGSALADKANAPVGTTVILTAIPNSGYVFKQWRVVSGDVTLSPNATTNPATFTMPAGAVSIEAEFAEEYAIDLSNDGRGTAWAAVGGAAAVKAQQGATVTITAMPNSGYMFKQWTVVNGDVSLSPNTTTNPVTFTMPAGAVRINAEFISEIIAAYFGTWRWESGDYKPTLTITIDKLVYRDIDGDGFTVEDLVWTSVLNPANASYPTGYVLAGKLTAYKGYTIFNDGVEASIGDNVRIPLYMHTNRSSLLENTHGPFIKQSAAAKQSSLLLDGDRTSASGQSQPAGIKETTQGPASTFNKTTH